MLHGSVDLGLVAFPNKHKELQIIPFAEDELVLVTHPEHPLAKKKSVKLSDLQGLDFIAFERDIPTRKATD